jgi:hypothetical protein
MTLDSTPTAVAKHVEVWVCPTVDCGNYFAASGLAGRNLNTEKAQARAEDRYDYKLKYGRDFKHTRANCPDCRQRGLDVERQLVMLMALVPVVEPESIAA